MSAASQAKFHRTPTALLHPPRHVRVHRGLALTHHQSVLFTTTLQGLEGNTRNGQRARSLSKSITPTSTCPPDLVLSLHSPNVLTSLTQVLHPLHLFIIIY